MGYSEICCQICGVSFNVSRFRTEHEPPSAAWHNTGDGTEPFVKQLSTLERARCIRDGCFFVRRSLLVTEIHDLQRWPPPDSAYLTVDIDSSEFKENGIDENVPGYNYADGLKEWEHIAGLDCRLPTGYNGQKISVAAMRGCNTAQCLVPKRADWEPDASDEPFESLGQFFLSGLTDSVKSRDMGKTKLFPTRHGIRNLLIDNCLWIPESENRLAMPFHPTCLEIFKRASLARYGTVDVDGLIGWWKLERDYEQFTIFPRHQAVKAGDDQWWRHNQGDEFLAANPCFVPELAPIISSAKLEISGNAPLPDGITTAEETPTRHRPVHDVFVKVPLEIKCLVVSLLSISDIVNLQQASDSFKSLPQALFFDALGSEMPWFYEAWCSLPISRWATTTSSELRDGDRPKDIQMEALSRDRTNWNRVMTELDQVRTSALGLQNRKRIWEDCQEIMRRVDAYRKQGRIEALREDEL